MVTRVYRWHGGCLYWDMRITAYEIGGSNGRFGWLVGKWSLDQVKEIIREMRRRGWAQIRVRTVGYFGT